MADDPTSQPSATPAGTPAVDPTTSPTPSGVPGAMPAAPVVNDPVKLLAAHEALKVEHKAERARAADLATKLKKFEDASLSESERLTKRTAELEAQLAQRDYADMQRAVAVEHNLPADLAARLQGATREELAADAQVLAKLVTAPVAATPAARATNAARQTPAADKIWTQAEIADPLVWAKNRDEITQAMRDGRVV